MIQGASVHPGVAAALAAAALFGAGTPMAKQLGTVDPWLLAGLLVLGRGVGMTPGTIGTATESVGALPLDQAAPQSSGSTT
jgi:drug/metabolite transporter (DMT)-like permease